VLTSPGRITALVGSVGAGLSTVDVLNSPKDTTQLKSIPLYNEVDGEIYLRF